MNELEELLLLLRPAGGGVYLVSTGREEQLELQKRIYNAANEADIAQKFRNTLERISSARVAILAIPSDVGAGFLRGSNMGPQAIRTSWLASEPALHGEFGSNARKGVIDIGDIFVVPQLLHDEMLAESQKSNARRALYPNLKEEQQRTLPVSPLSMAERALELIFRINPRIKPVLLGGDHSTAWPLAAVLARTQKEPWGIVQSDAHTDLLEERLGIKYCFATWSFHASRVLQNPSQMVQVGIRASRRDRAHWESVVGVRQFWADECLKDPEGVIARVIAHLKSLGTKSIYFSNDIDGTDMAFADATGTPEPFGLTPDFVVELIRTLGREIGLCAGDVMEVAPPIPRTPDGTEKTVKLAVRYLRETVEALLR